MSLALRPQPELDQAADGFGTGHLGRVRFDPGIERGDVGRGDPHAAKDCANRRASDPLLLSVIR